MHVHIGTKKYVIIEESLCDGLWDWDISIERITRLANDKVLSNLDFKCNLK